MLPEVFSGLLHVVACEGLERSHKKISPARPAEAMMGRAVLVANEVT